MSNQGLKSLDWCFTVNNPKQPVNFTAQMTYLVVGTEESKSGTPHYQGYVIFESRRRLTAVKKIIPRAAWFPRYQGPVKFSTPKQASDYCKKDGLFTEYGVLPPPTNKVGTESNKRKWVDAYTAAKDHDLEKIPEDMLIRYYHAFKRIIQDNPKQMKSLDTTCGIWITGPTGVGKSKLAREMYPDLYDKPLNKWWDGYKGQDFVLLDDVEPHHGIWLGTFLKRMTDHYSFPAEQKGTTIQIRPKQIIVTSQYTIEEVFSTNGMDMPLLAALNRRFKVICLPEDFEQLERENQPKKKKPKLLREDAQYFTLVEDLEQAAIDGEPTVHTKLRPNIIDLTESDEEMEIEHEGVIIPETQYVPTYLSSDLDESSEDYEGIDYDIHYK